MSRRTHPAVDVRGDRRARHRSRRRVCACGHLRYDERHDALLALRATRVAAGRAAWHGVTSERREQRAFACPRCRGWHLTSQPRAGRPVPSARHVSRARTA